MKVLMLANNDVGLYKFRKELICELLHPGSYLKGRNANPCEVYISLPDGDFVSELKNMGCRFINTPVDRRGMNLAVDLKLFLTYKTILKKIKPDIVLGYTIKPNIYGSIACRLQKIPYIANITGLGTALENRGVLQHILINLYRYALKDAKTIFFQNKENMKFFKEKNIVKRKSRLIPGSGINLEEYSCETYPQILPFAERFLFIGRIMKDKGVEELFAAAVRIKEEYPKVSFDIVGGTDEDYSAQIEELEAKGVLKYWNQQPEVRSFIKTCSAVILPSYHEGMANVLLEAAATGRPVLASNIPGCIETFDEGVSGLGFNPKDSETLYQKIKEFLLLTYEEKVLMGSAGREKMEKEFDRRQIVNAYLEEIGK